MKRQQGQLQTSAHQRANQLAHQRANQRANQRAFTLVEMLVVGVIIVILITLTLVAARMAANLAKETKTRGTIQKLDVAMQQIFEMNEDQFRIIKNRIDKDFPLLDLAERQRIAAHGIRDWMRMEMPQSWAEVYDSTDPTQKLEPLEITLDSGTYSVAESPLLDYYWQEYDRVRQSGKTPSRAALLFLIIQNLNPEALEAFHGSEVITGDDGLSVFADAWGNPIQFLRTAPAFHGSDVQPNVLALAGYVPGTDKENNGKQWTDRYPAGQPLRNAMAQARAMYPDPTDERGGAVGWFLYPLIYSAGLDGKYGLIDENEDINGNPVSPTVGVDGILDPFAFPLGMPFGGHFDNIHNHQRYKVH